MNMVKQRRYFNRLYGRRIKMYVDHMVYLLYFIPEFREYMLLNEFPIDAEWPSKYDIVMYELKQLFIQLHSNDYPYKDVFGVSQLDKEIRTVKLTDIALYGLGKRYWKNGASNSFEDLCEEIFGTFLVTAYQPECYPKNRKYIYHPHFKNVRTIDESQLFASHFETSLYKSCKCGVTYFGDLNNDGKLYEATSYYSLQIPTIQLFNTSDVITPDSIDKEKLSINNDRNVSLKDLIHFTFKTKPLNKIKSNDLKEFVYCNCNESIKWFEEKRFNNLSKILIFNLERFHSGRKDVFDFIDIPFLLDFEACCKNEIVSTTRNKEFLPKYIEVNRQKMCKQIQDILQLFCNMNNIQCIANDVCRVIFDMMGINSGIYYELIGLLCHIDTGIYKGRYQMYLKDTMNEATDYPVELSKEQDHWFVCGWDGLQPVSINEMKMLFKGYKKNENADKSEKFIQTYCTNTAIYRCLNFESLLVEK
eukprot:392734_1